MNSLGVALVWCLLQVSVASLMGGAVYWLASKAGVGRLAAIGVLGTVLGLTVAAFSPWPSWLAMGQTPIPVSSSARLAGHADLAGEHEVARGRGADVPGPLGQPNGPFYSIPWQALWAQLMRPHATETASRLAFSASWSAVVAAALLLVAIVGLLRLVAAAVFLRRLWRESKRLDDQRLMRLAESLARKLGITHRVQLKESATLQTAATFGFRRPAVLLPSAWREWPTDQVRAVLAHELAHVAQGDFLLGLIGQLAVAAHFYHPLVHWLAHRLRLEQELAADAVAARLAGGQETYLRSLAALTLCAERVRIGWAAQTFLPTRSLFVRRIEMLKRTKKMAPEKLSGGARAAVIGALVAVGLGAVGLRGPRATSAPLVAAEPASEDDKIPTKKFGKAVPRSSMEPGERAAFDAKFDMGYIPEDALYAVRFRPFEIFKDKAMQAAAKEVSQLLANRPSGDIFPVTEINTIDTVLMTTYPTVQGNLGMRVVFRTVEPVSRAKAELYIQSAAISNPVQVEHPMGSYYQQEGAPEGPAIWRIGEHTFVFDTSAVSLKQFLDRIESGPTPPAWLGDTEPNADTQVWLAVNTRKIVLPPDQGDRRALIGGFPLQMISPLFREMLQVVASVQIAPVIRVAADATCPSPGAAGHVEETTRAMLVMLRNLLAEQLQAELPTGTPATAFVPIGRLIQQLLDGVGVESTGKHVLLTARTQLQASEVFRTLAPVMGQARVQAHEASLRIQSQKNLRQIALALHNYHDARRSFPPPVLYDKETGTPYSWRVAVLPFLEQSALYDLYRRDEPWDSEHNLKIAKTVVPVFTSPTEPTSTNAAYFALVGSETVFAGKDGVEFQQIPDGMAQTLLVVEAKRNIPWTKPEDIPYAKDRPLPRLGGFFAGGFHASFVDGSVRFFSDGIRPQTLRNLIEKADGNRVDRGELDR